MSLYTVSSQNSRPEQRSLISGDSDKPPTKDYGATTEVDKLSKEDLVRKLEMLENVLENQRKFLEDHDIKIQEIENVINNIVADKEEKDKHSDTGKEK